MVGGTITILMPGDPGLDEAAAGEFAPALRPALEQAIRFGSAILTEIGMP
jgi:hypothetical protein